MSVATRRRQVRPDDRWQGLVGLYGGYVGALFADAAVVADYRLASLDIRFVASVDHRDLELVTIPMHRGRSIATTRLRLEQDRRVRAEATAVLLRHGRSAATVRHLAPGAGDPPFDHVARPHVQGDLAFARNLDIRAPLPTGVEDGTTAWLRLAAPGADLGLHTGHAAVCVLMDALLPVLFAGNEPPAFVPTLEFGYVFAPAAADVEQQWFIGENHLDWLADDFCAEDATLRDARTGRLVARQRQLRSVRRRLEHEGRSR